MDLVTINRNVHNFGQRLCFYHRIFIFYFLLFLRGKYVHTFSFKVSASQQKGSSCSCSENDSML